MSTRRILLIGATGVFGRRLAGHVAGIDGVELLVASRSAAKGETLAAELRASGARATIAACAIDRAQGFAAALEIHRPWLVIDASGPFQAMDHRAAREVLAAGAHLIDLADARDYIVGFGAALDGEARARGLVALTGASSSPALSAAAAADLTRGWRRVDSIDIAITPGGRSEVGPAVIGAVLSYAGRPVPVWREGELQTITGWGSLTGRCVAGLGHRWLSPVETADAALLPHRHQVRSRVAFHAGLESRVEQLGLVLLARLRARGWLGPLDGLTQLFVQARRLTRITTGDRGGMVVDAAGIDGEGKAVRAVWTLIATDGQGLHVPTLPALAAVRALLSGGLEPGARPAAGAIPLAAIEAEMTPLPITTRREVTTTAAPGLFGAALGEGAYAGLPGVLRAFHDADGHPVWRGRAVVDGPSGLLARLVASAIGLPRTSGEVPVTVSVDRRGTMETWTRNFGGRRFSSVLRPAAGGFIDESFGPVRARLAVRTKDGDILLPVASWRFFGIPMPLRLGPRSIAREFVDDQGRFRFDVEIRLPLAGRVAHYRGWLAPRPWSGHGAPEGSPSGREPVYEGGEPKLDPETA